MWLCEYHSLPGIIHKFAKDNYLPRYPELDSLVQQPLEFLKTVKVCDNIRANHFMSTPSLQVSILFSFRCLATIFWRTQSCPMSFRAFFHPRLWWCSVWLHPQQLGNYSYCTYRTYYTYIIALGGSPSFAREVWAEFIPNSGHIKRDVYSAT